MKGEPLSSVLEPAVETPMVGKSVITLDDLSIRQIQEMLHKAQYIDSHRKEVAHTCEGRVLATLFYEPSTRTRLSFETAMLRLGGKVIGFAGAQLASVTKGETIADPEAAGVFPKGIRKNMFYEQPGAERAVQMLIKKLNGEAFRTEYPMPVFDRVAPRPAIADISKATIIDPVTSPKFEDYAATYAELRKAKGVTIERLWDCYAIKKPEKVKGTGTLRQLADLVSIIRFEMGEAEGLQPFADKVNYNFQQWTFRRNAGAVHFTPEQMEWLQLVKDHIATSLSIQSEDLDLSPFDSKGGLGRFYEVFGEQYEAILVEMNRELVA